MACSSLEVGDASNGERAAAQDVPEDLLDDPATFRLGEVGPIGQRVAAAPRRMVQ